MSPSQFSPEASTSCPPSPKSTPLLTLPTLSLISDLDVEDFSGHVSRRGNTGGDSREKQSNTTAARRASHNAVERLRRDKLNARILELASLLPNLAGVRRPSRIAITKSSIAHIHSSRRHRMLAAQQLRALHAENESLRTEVNHWRRRAGVPGVMEPRRGDAFMLIASGAELELEPVDTCDDEEVDEQFHNAMRFSQGYSACPRPQSQSPLGYGVPSPSSSSSPDLPPYATPYPSPPSAAHFTLPPYAKFDMTMAPAHDPRIACPTPANPLEAQHFVLKAEDEWAMYGAPPTLFHDQPHGSW
ncbi:hypothetical protein DFH07DRAFT_1064716 [Mycena maculata]|uniref:BHLH domain-containing protein n=1 Tax=Mycena maculata TaxID=230809 RepID=A0AAD7I959_9AGAR|nr:hypothetical protein DFH07DRAFT_1064716 [Mycena maculata]